MLNGPCLGRWVFEVHFLSRELADNLGKKRRRKRSSHFVDLAEHVFLPFPRFCRNCYSQRKAGTRNNGPAGTPQGNDRYLIALHNENIGCAGRSCHCWDGNLSCNDVCVRRREYNMLGTDRKGYDEKQQLV